MQEKVEIIKALKIREKRAREINNQLRERMHADEEVASSLRQKFEDARKETLRHQVSVTCLCMDLTNKYLIPSNSIFL